MRIEVFKDRSGREQCWRWRLRHTSLATKRIEAVGGEPFLKSSIMDAVRAVSAAVDNGPEYYLDMNNEHRWRIVAKNGRKIAKGNYAFHHEESIKEHFRLCSRHLKNPTIVWLDQ